MSIWIAFDNSNTYDNIASHYKLTHYQHGSAKISHFLLENSGREGKTPKDDYRMAVRYVPRMTRPTAGRIRVVNAQNHRVRMRILRDERQGNHRLPRRLQFRGNMDAIGRFRGAIHHRSELHLQHHHEREDERGGQDHYEYGIRRKSHDSFDYRRYVLHRTTQSVMPAIQYYGSEGHGSTRRFRQAPQGRGTRPSVV